MVILIFKNSCFSGKLKVQFCMVDVVLHRILHPLQIFGSAISSHKNIQQYSIRSEIGFVKRLFRTIASLKFLDDVVGGIV